MINKAVGLVTLTQQTLFAPRLDWLTEARILYADALLLRGGGQEPVPLVHAAGSRGESS